MKNLKIIGGFICVILAIVAFFGGFNGAPLMFSGVFIWGLFAYFLFKSASKEDININSSENRNLNKEQTLQKNINVIFEKQKEDSLNTSRQVGVKDNIQAIKDSLYELKKSGILIDSEFEEKMKLLEEQKLTYQVQNSNEYHNLKALFDSQILSKEEFEAKIELLKVKNPNLLENLRKKLIGTWKDKIGTIEFFNNDDFVFNDRNKHQTKGRWFLEDYNTIVVIFNLRKEFFIILRLDENILSYKHNESYFNLKRQ